MTMPAKVTIAGKKPRKGKRLTKTSKWKLAAVSGGGRTFTATLIATHNFGKKRLAIFSVPKRSM
jgi:hypothetical protein